jgi:hypothetical protein
MRPEKIGAPRACLGVTASAWLLLPHEYLVFGMEDRVRGCEWSLRKIIVNTSLRRYSTW